MSNDDNLLLSVTDLTVDFPTPLGYRPVIDRLSLDFRAGETMGIVGESGSGKSMTSLAIMGLLPRAARVSSGTVMWQGRNLLDLSSRELTSVRGREIAMIFQEPSSCLNPAFTVGEQIAESVRTHTDLSRGAVADRVIELLGDVGIPDPRRRKDAYPHQFSGGMAQRVMIAMAIACNPKMLIADEPTTALDVTLQAEILDLLEDLTEERGIALAIISHDLGVVSRLSDRIAVMYAGQVVEEGVGAGIFSNPTHPYTQALVDARPDAHPAAHRLRTIPSYVPALTEMPEGCRFHPRCAHAVARCGTEAVDLLPVAVESSTRCLRYGEIELLGIADVGAEVPGPAPVAVSEAAEPVMSARGLTKLYPVRSSILRRTVGHVRAVDGVDLDIYAGETLGLVGESGSGKSTSGRLLVGLIGATGGSVTFQGQEITQMNRRQLQAVRSDVQVVFQDPYGSFDPKMRVGESVAEPLIQLGESMTSAQREARVLEVLDWVKLPGSFARRYPHELSGGQLQRLAIARALTPNPRLIVCDEAVSALDVSTQASVINLLQDLQDELGVAYLFISHDINVVRHISDRIAVMYQGKIVETGDAETVLAAPQHDYTRTLLAAVTNLEPEARSALQ